MHEREKKKTHPRFWAATKSSQHSVRFEKWYETSKYSFGKTIRIVVNDGERREQKKIFKQQIDCMTKSMRQQVELK